MPIGYYLHDLSPFLIRFGESVGIRWYGLAYVAAMVALDPKQDRPLFAFQVLLSAYQSALDHTVKDSREYREWLALQKQEKAGFH